MCKYKFNNIVFLHLFKIIIFIFIDKISSEGTSVTTEYQFTNSLEQQKEIYIDGIVEIKSEINVLQKTVVSIKGDAEDGVLNFNNNFYGIYLDSIEQFYISNISIFGKITTNKIEKIYFKNVYIHGKIVAYNESKNAEYIFEDCKFVSPDREDRYAFEFYESNVTFKNCEFVGNKNIRNILFLWGNKDNLENKIEVHNTYFNGNNNSLCFNGNNSYIKITNSHFSNCRDYHLDHGY
ncbi:hypothetical protein PIROE2DRAFT_21446 [Piromyces sp. E2]|nr:hypothetical protein PIROE2DRAFT_21446 [Piromyces sp. E2]|eukprot:OUM57773.1 hypothetical protein PIROE2DRAFT_21446 [Piromyces sp. E2]